MKKLFAKQILLADGWKNDKTLTIDNGIITQICDGNEPDSEVVSGPVIPGMVNCHSHAFQRAFAGFSEQGSADGDSFWTWRQVMYDFLSTLSVAEAEVIARQLYIEMLKAGYTRVAEFHYLHHDVTGQPYPQLSSMANALFNAANDSGIGMTMLPVLYQYSGFGQQKPTSGQRRFINSTMQFNQLVSECVQLSADYDNANVGIAPHSLRATDKAAILSAVEHVRTLSENAPIHIHISEQMKEVNDCLANTGRRPVQWLLDNFELDKHWCLIHATHINDYEVEGIISSNAIAGICPTTEANLGDGIFPTAEFLAQNGTFAIGSDSHISVNPIEELRWLEYAQRLIKQQRTVLANRDEYSVGINLWRRAALGGAQSTNSNTGELGVGKQADLLVLDNTKLNLFANSDQHRLDSLIFASQQSPVRDVMVNGTWQIVQGRHAMELDTAAQYSSILEQKSK